MEKQFWQEKWLADETGFHQAAPNPLLRKYFFTPGALSARRVFVPLCGKSVDMIYLQEQGCEVIGLELSDIAVQSFFSDNGLDVAVSETGDFRRFRSTQFEILCGDFFSVTKAQLGDITAVYDRAALIALPREMRLRYAGHLRGMLNSGMEILLITLEYAQDSIKPPPFAVFHDEVSSLYGSWCDIDFLEKAVTDVKGTPCHQLAYRLTVK